MNKIVADKINKLQNGEWVVSKESGNSMTPILKSMEPVVLQPITDWMVLTPGDIAYAKYRGTVYTHKVYAVDESRGIELGNNHGHKNGWTRNVYAKAHLIPRERQNDCIGYLEELKKKFNDNRCEMIVKC